MSTANQKQIGGNHYKNGGEELWDRIERLGLNYFQGSAIKYIERCYRKGNTVQDLLKAVHYLEKLIEIETAKTSFDLNPGKIPQHMQHQRDIQNKSVQAAQQYKEMLKREFYGERSGSTIGATDPFIQGPNLIDTRNFRQQSNVIDPKRD